MAPVKNDEAADPVDGEYIVRLRGLPWSCREDELKKFFKGKFVYSTFKIKLFKS